MTSNSSPYLLPGIDHLQNHPFRMHLKVECTTEQNKNILMRDLQLHKNPYRHLTFIRKPIEKQKMILLGMPSNYGKEQTQFQHFTKLMSISILYQEHCTQIRDGQLASSHAHSIVPSYSDGGLQVGLHTALLQEVPGIYLVTTRNTVPTESSVRPVGMSTPPTTARTHSAE